MIAIAKSKAKRGSANNTPCVASTGIAIAAANTSPLGTQRGTFGDGPSSSVLVTCHAINPAAAAFNSALRIFPAVAAACTESRPKSGVRIAG